MSTIILASGSPRRKELMEQMGFHPVIVKSRVEEVITKTDPAEVVEELSQQKAQDVADHLIEYLVDIGLEDSEKNERDPEELSQLDLTSPIILGADTVVAIDGEILGKPASHREAYEMIKRLQGRVHQVYTGVTILRTGAPSSDKTAGETIALDGRQTAVCLTFSEKTDVHVVPMTDEEIWAYADTDEPMDKAGAYGIQGTFGKYISRIEGDYYNVVGLPMAHVYQELK